MVCARLALPFLSAGTGPLKLEQLCCLPHAVRSRPISGDGNGILADGVVGC